MTTIYDYQGNVVREQSLNVPWLSDMHRGYSSPTVAENTLPAFHRAYLNGANWVEMDARLASDGVYVCFHDATVTVGGVTYTISNETSETLTSLVLSTDPEYGDCTIPTIESILKLCLYGGMTANIDCKSINPETLAKLVVDSGMSGRAVYANTSNTNAERILAVDPNAGFLFGYTSANISAWKETFADYHVRERSYAWSSSVSYEAMEETRTAGFKYLLSEVSDTTNMPYAPDVIEFVATADCKTINQNYLDSLVLV